MAAWDWLMDAWDSMLDVAPVVLGVSLFVLVFLGEIALVCYLAGMGGAR